MIQSTSFECRKAQKAADLFSVSFLGFMKQEFTFPEPLTQHLNFYFAEQPHFSSKMPQHTKNIRTELLNVAVLKCLLYIFRKKNRCLMGFLGNYQILDAENNAIWNSIFCGSNLL